MVDGFAVGCAAAVVVEGRGVVVALFTGREEELVTDGIGAGAAVAATCAGAGAPPLVSVVEAPLQPATRAAVTTVTATRLPRSAAARRARHRRRVLVGPAVVAVIGVSLDRPPAPCGSREEDSSPPRTRPVNLRLPS